MHLLIVILDDLQRLPDLLAAWREIGVGATLVESQGGYRLSNWLDKVGLGGVNRLLQGQRFHNQRLLLSVLQDEESLEKAITEADRVLEGFDKPGSGVLFALPVSRTLGLSKKSQTLPEELPSINFGMARLGIDPTTPVSKIVDILGLAPCTVYRGDSLQHVVEAILSDPSINVVGVVSEEERLVGLIDMASLSQTLFYQIFPEVYLAELHDLQAVKDFIKLPTDANTAGDIMQPADYVREDDTLLTAFKILQKRQLEGIPVVDVHNRPKGYIHLIELMAVCIQQEDTDKTAESP
jgi:CBS domain-containing protein